MYVLNIKMTGQETKCKHDPYQDGDVKCLNNPADGAQIHAVRGPSTAEIWTS